MTQSQDIIAFERFELDRDNRRLLRDGVPVELGNRYFDALVLLVENRGELVTKTAFMDAVWNGIPVTDEALTQCIRTLRRTLGDSAANPRFIQTVPKHGYRFLHEQIGQQEKARQGVPVSRLAGACTLAGLAAGLCAGLFYGIAAGTGGGGGAVSLAAMVGALGLLAGSGLGAGMAAMLTWRPSVRWELVAGGGLAGLTVGALGNLLGRESIALLSGQILGPVAGPLEGLLIGAASGTGVWMVQQGRRKEAVLATAIIGGVAAGILIYLSGGTLLAGSLASLQEKLPGMQIQLGRLGLASSDNQSGWLAVTVIEAAIFTTAMATAALLAFRKDRQ